MKALTFFKNKTAVAISNVQQALTPAPTAEEVRLKVEEIHHAFYTEVDVLSEMARNKGSMDSDKAELLKKAERLRNLGFNNTKEVKNSAEEELRLDRIKWENQQKEGLIQAIEYFQQKYPQYKFITEDSVKKICHKYGLIYGDIDKYIGTVPDNNLAQMEAFKVDETDECYQKIQNMYSHDLLGKRTIAPMVVEVMNKEKYEKKIQEYNNLGHEIGHRNMLNYYGHFVSKCQREIAAPLKDFNTQGMELNDGQLMVRAIQVPDPVVLHPVIYDNKKYYLIETAWGGPEASDPLVVNEKNN